MQIHVRPLACSLTLIALASACGAAPQRTGRASADNVDGSAADDVVVEGDAIVDVVDIVAGKARAVASLCQVTQEPDVSQVIASAHGLVVTTRTLRDERTIFAFAGRGCDLEPQGQPPVASHLLLDMDDGGALYAANEGYWSSVTRTAADGSEDVIVSAGRGIWSFGISADGSRFSSSACGPTGIFGSDDERYTPLYDMGAEGGVLVDGGDVYVNVDFSGSVTRTDATGTSSIEGLRAEGGALARCGDAACIVTAQRVVVIDGDSHFFVDGAAVGLVDGATIAGAAAADHHQGLYLLLRQEGAVDRVVYASFAD